MHAEASRVGVGGCLGFDGIVLLVLREKFSARVEDSGVSMQACNSSD